MTSYSNFDELLKSGKTWSVVYADPPWSFSNSNVKYGDGSVSNVKDKYKVASLEDLKAMPVNRVIGQDAALLMWTTDAHTEWAIKVGYAWGFKFSTVQFVWHKLTSTSKSVAVLGPWGMKSCESCLLFTRGKAHSVLLTGRNIKQYHAELRSGHSEKPEHFALETQRMFGLSRPLELFARRAERPGWDFMGDEL